MFDVIQIAVAVLIGAAVILTALALTAFVARLRQSTAQPGIDEVLDALLPYFYQAILAGERAALWGMQQTDSILTGVNKAQVANSLYDLLPDVILVGEIPLPISTIKRLVTREAFAAWVKELYDGTQAFIRTNEDYLRAQVETLKPQS